MVRIATLDDDGLLTPGQVPALATLGATATGEALVEAVDAAAARTALGLGTAATTAATAYATAAQGALADTAVQPGDLGNAAGLDVGTTAGTVAAGDDSRLSDARTPTAHASTHATGQSDAIAPGDIGAATAAQGALADTAVQPGDLDTAVTALDADAASALRVQQDARLSSTIEAAIEAAGGGSVVQIGTLSLPESPTAGQSVSVLADTATVIPEGVRWDSGGEPVTAADEQRIITLIWTGTDWVGTYSLTFAVAEAPTDTTDPEWTATFTMGTPGETTVTATASALATDDTAVTGYQVSYDDGATSAPIGVSGFDFTLTGEASTTYATTKLRAVDAAGNTSAWVSVPSYTMASPADTTDPEWTATFTLGTPTASTVDVTPSALATDNVAVTSYEQTLDSTAGTVVWTDIGMPVGGVLTITGMTPSTTYANAALRAKDAAGNTSTALAVPSITTAAPAAPPDLGWLGWWYADDLTLTDGDPVETWADRDAGPALSSATDRRPVYRASDADFGGAPVVNFDIAGVPYLETAYLAWSVTAQPITVVAVGTFPYVSGEQSNLFHGHNGSYEHGLYRHPTSGHLYVDGGAAKSTESTAPADGLAHLFVVTFSGASSTLTIDDSTVSVTGDVGAEASVGIVLGTSDSRSVTQPFRGAIALAAIKQGVPSAGDLSDLWTWAQSRYGL